MGYIKAIKEGIDLINRNWQLILVQVIAMIINLLLAVVVIVLPVIIAVLVVGADARSLIDAGNSPEEIVGMLSNYVGLAVIAGFFVILYLLIASLLSIYVYGASAGVIVNSMRNPAEKFTAKQFFRFGKELFMPMFRFLAAALLIVIVVMLAILLITVLLAAVSDYMGQFESNVIFFIKMFIILLFVSVVLLLLTFCISVVFYGTAILVVDNKGAIDSVKGAVSYLYKRPSAYWLYCIMLGGIVIIAVILTIMGYSFRDIPVFGAILYLPYQFVTSVIQSYIGLIVTAVIFVYYNANRVSAGRSIQQSDISRQAAHGQEGTPPPSGDR